FVAAIDRFSSLDETGNDDEFIDLAAFCVIFECIREVGARVAAEHHRGTDVAGITAGPGHMVGLHRYFSNPSKPRRTLISRVTKGSKTLQPRTGTRHTTDSRGPMREDSSQSQTRLSASNREELLVGYAEGVPVQELARRFNTHRATVREIARRAGHPSRAPEHSQQLRSEAAHLYAERFALSQVAAQLGIGDEAVRSAVVANGGKIRPKGRRRSHA